MRRVEVDVEEEVAVTSPNVEYLMEYHPNPPTAGHLRDDDTDADEQLTQTSGTGDDPVGDAFRTALASHSASEVDEDEDDQGARRGWAFYFQRRQNGHVMGCGARLGVAKAMVVEPLPLSSTERPHAGRWITFSRLRLMFADPLSSAESVARANQTHALIFFGLSLPRFAASSLSRFAHDVYDAIRPRSLRLHSGTLF